VTGNAPDRPDLSEYRRRRTVLEALLGFLAFFTVLSLVQAVWNVLQDDPDVWPSLLLAVLLLATWVVWRRWRRYD
jgi:Flp pilus assembly protein TadB